MNSTRRRFQCSGNSIRYTAPPSRPKSARAPGNGTNAGSPSVTPSGSGRTWTGGGSGRTLAPAVAEGAVAFSLSPVHAGAVISVTMVAAHANRLTMHIARHVPSGARTNSHPYTGRLAKGSISDVEAMGRSGPVYTAGFAIRQNSFPSGSDMTAI